MNQFLTYCTTRLFSRATLPLASLRIRVVEPGNDNERTQHNENAHRPAPHVDISRQSRAQPTHSRDEWIQFALGRTKRQPAYLTRT